MGHGAIRDESFGLCILQLLEEYIECGEEDEKVELKQTLSLTSRSERAEFARDVCAIANTDGQRGFLVVGVVDRRHRKSNRREDYILGFECRDFDRLERHAVDAVRVYCDPPPKVTMHRCLEPQTQRTILVVEVPRSRARPHVVSRTSNDIEEGQIWVRAGAQCRRATSSELHAMLGSQDRAVILNFTHPISDPDREHIRWTLNCRIEEVHNIDCSFDNAKPLAGQVRRLLDALSFTPRTWQKTPLIVNLPGLSVGAGMVLAEIHGRSGHFPTVLRLTPSEDPEGTTTYSIAEVINLQGIREQGRATRY